MLKNTTISKSIKGLVDDSPKNRGLVDDSTKKIVSRCPIKITKAVPKKKTVSKSVKILKDDTSSSESDQDNTNEDTPKYKCNGLTRKRTPCVKDVNTSTGFCDTWHKVLQSYTSEQFDAYKQNPSHCTYCQNVRLVEKNQEFCVTCEHEYPKCNGDIRNGEQCKRRTTRGLRFCIQYHNDYNVMPHLTIEEIKALPKCKTCTRKVPLINGTKYCSNCVELKIDKPKTKTQIEQEIEETCIIPTICNAFCRTKNNCKLRVIVDSYYCKEHQEWNSYSDADILRCDKCLKCEHIAPINTNHKIWSDKWCDTCVEKYVIACCPGLDSNGKNCTKMIIKGNMYCTFYHGDMNNYTEYQRENIQCCPKCGYFRHIINNICTLCIQKDNSKIYCIGKSSMGKKCGYTITGTKTCKYHTYMETYTDHMINNLKLCKKCPRPKMKYFEGISCDNCMQKQYNDIEQKCRGLMSDGNQCTNKKTNSTQVCNIHADLIDYDDHMFNNMKLCSSNNHYRFCGKFDTCIKCRERGKSVRDQAKIKREHLDMCIKCGSHPKKVGDYCGIHAYIEKLIEAQNMGHRICCVKRCNNIINKDSTHTKCERCVDKYKDDYVKCKQKRKLFTDTIDKYRNDCNWSASICAICKDSKPMNEFLLHCRVYDEETGELNDGYSYNCNGCRLIMNNNDKDRTRNDHCTNDTIISLTYVRNCQSHRRNIKWSMSIDDAIKIINMPCKYCNVYKEMVNDDGITYSCMGIDRVDNKIGYTVENCVSCCSLCNYFKYTHSVDDFLEYCLNIYNNFGTLKKSTELLTNLGFAKYMIDAKNRGKQFRLTKEQFNNIILYKCYYCGNDNGSDQIGIDRVDSNRGYCLQTNDLVPACKICNDMKKDYNIRIFYEHIVDILNHNGHNVASKFDDIYNMKWSKERKTLEIVITKLQEVIPYNDCTNSDRRDKKCMYSDTYYINNIWKSYDVTKIDPILIFCETPKEKDTWKYYRNITSSVKRSKSPGFRNIKILVIDRFTGKYLGIIELSSTVWNCKAIDDLLEWDSVEKQSNLNNIINITTCVPLQPLGYNFSVGKLLVMLTFSTEVLTYYKNKYKCDIYGVVTYSINNTCYQYEDLEEISRIGTTSGFGDDNTSKKDDDTNKYIRNMLQKWNIDIQKNQMYNTQAFCEYIGIKDATHHGVTRGIYFGFTGDNSKDMLKSLNKNQNIFNQNTKQTNEITKLWMIKYAIPRFNDLTKRKNVQFNHNYNYYEYYVSDHGKDNNRKYGKYTPNPKYTDDDIQTMIYIWYINKHKKYTEIENEICDSIGKKVDTRFLKNLIFGNTMQINILDKDCSDDTNNTHKYNIKSIITTHQKNIEKLYDDLLEQEKDKILQNMISKNQINKDYIKTKKYMINVPESDIIFNLNMKKTNLFIYFYERDISITGSGCNKFTPISFSLNNLVRGDWNITKDHLLKNDTILEMQSIDATDFIPSHMFILNNNNHTIPFIAFYQSEVKTDIIIDDARLYSNPHTITGKGNIFVRNNPNTIKINIYTYLNKTGQINKILIKYDDIRLLQNKGSSCNDDCSCIFKGTTNTMRKPDQNIITNNQQK
jgi:hypothetical protein